jgi:hypothetical protein
MKSDIAVHPLASFLDLNARFFFSGCSAGNSSFFSLTLISSLGD